MTYKMWNKHSPINGKTAEQVIANNPVYSIDDVVVINNDDGTIVDALPVSYLPAGDTVAERCTAYIAQIKPPVPTAAEIRIAELKHYLAESDYQAIKFAEGWITADDYAPMKAQRQAWRDEINRLEGSST